MAKPAIRFLFCKKCKTIVNAASARLHNNVHFCPTCLKLLSYFGRESSRLSSEALAIYTTTTDSLSSYIGRYDTDLYQPSTHVMILECEDQLKFDPTNTEALECLAKHYCSTRQVALATPYVKTLLTLNHRNHVAHRLLADIYIFEKKYKDALPHLRYCLIQQKSVSEFEKLGYCFLHLNHLPNALKAFINAKTLATAPETLDRLSTIIDILTSEL